MSNEPFSGLPSGTPLGVNLLCQTNIGSLSSEKITQDQMTQFIKGKIINVGLGDVAIGLIDGTLAGFSQFSYDAGAQKVVMENVRISLFLNPGVVHNDSSGNLTSSLIVGADVDPTFLSGTNHGDLTTSAIDTSNPNGTGMFLTVGSPSTPQNLQLEAATGSFGGVLTAGTQTIGGDKTFTGTINASNLSNTNTGNVSIFNVGVTPNPAGMTLIGQALNLEQADSSNPGVVSAGTQTFGGNKTFTGTIVANNLSGTNHGDFTTNTVDALPPNATGMNVTAGSSSTPQVLSLCSATATTPGVINAGIQTFGGDKNFAGNISAANLSNTNTGNVSLLAFGTSSNVAGLTLTGQQINLEPASASFPGGVSTGTQTFAGNKTFSGTIAASNLSNTNTGDISLSNVGVTPNSAGMSLSAQVLNLQPADGTNPGVLSAGAQTIGGIKTFSSAPNLSSLTASTLLVLDASKNIISSSITSSAIATLNQTANQVLIGNGSNGITSSANFTYNGSGQLTLTDVGDGNLLILNNTNSSAVGHQLSLQLNGINTLSLGHNNSTNQSYLYSASTVIKFGTSNSEVARFSGSSLAIGTTLTNSPLQFNSVITQRIITLYEVGNDNNQFFGFGTNAATLRYQVAGTIHDHVFYAGTSSTTSDELFRIKGTKVVQTLAGGGLQFGNATASYIPSTLDYYEVTSFQSNTTGALVLTNYTINIIRSGNQTFLNFTAIPSQNAVAASTIVLSTALPARFRPASTQRKVFQGQRNVETALTIEVTSAGIVTIYGNTALAGFLNGQPAAVDSDTMTLKN